MPKTRYRTRILIDTHFIKWIFQSKLDSRTKFDIIRLLMFIKASSIEHPRCHNIILQEDFSELKESKIVTEEELRKIVKPMVAFENLFTTNDDEFSKRIKFAILLGNDTPFETVILTSNDKESNYKSNPHYEKVKSVIIKSDQVAIQFIRDIFKTYQENKRDYE